MLISWILFNVAIVLCGLGLSENGTCRAAAVCRQCLISQLRVACRSSSRQSGTDLHIGVVLFDSGWSLDHVHKAKLSHIGAERGDDLPCSGRLAGFKGLLKDWGGLGIAASFLIVFLLELDCVH